MCVCVCTAGLSFTPKEVGEHEVSVRKGGAHVNNSPFKITVGASEIGDASRVRAFGKGLTDAHTFNIAEFYVDTRNAGETGRVRAKRLRQGETERENERRRQS